MQKIEFRGWGGGRQGVEGSPRYGPPIAFQAWSESSLHDPWKIKHLGGTQKARRLWLDMTLVMVRLGVGDPCLRRGAAPQKGL